MDVALGRLRLTLIWNKNKQNNLLPGFSLDVNLGRYIYNILTRNDAEILLLLLLLLLLIIIIIIIKILVAIIFRSKRSYYSGIAAIERCLRASW